MKKLLLILLFATMWLSEAETQTYTNVTFWGKSPANIYSAELTYRELCVPLSYVLTCDSMRSAPGYKLTVFDGYDIFNRVVFYYLYRGMEDDYFTTKIFYNLRTAQLPTMIGVDSTKGYFQWTTGRSSLPTSGPPYTWKVYANDTL
jgi:hypothetical protein